MKKLVFIITLVLMLTSCQSTPEEAIVVQKNAENKIEKNTTKTSEESSEYLTDILDAPSNIKKTMEYPEYNLVVNIDTNVVIPNVKSIPLIEVEASEFSQELVDGFVNFLFEDEQIYDIDSGKQGLMTKTDIENEIVKLERIKLNYEDSPSDQQEIEEKIALLKNGYSVAPDTIHNHENISNGKLKIMNEQDNGLNIEYQYYGLNIENDDDLDKRKMLNINNIKYTDIESGNLNKINASLMYIDNEQFFNSNAKKPIVVHDGIQIDSDIEDNLGILPKEAEELVLDMLAKSGVDYMNLKRIYIVDDEQLGNVDGVISEVENYAYQICFSRVVNEIPCTYARGSQINIDAGGYVPTWNYETLDIRINNKGISHILWRAPIKTTGILSDNVKLLPFEVIFEKLENYVEMKYSELNNDDKKITIDIDRVALEYQRMKIEDGQHGTAMLSPVWNFYGVETKDYSWTESESDLNYLISVNAVDGSIFDSVKGY